MSSEAFIAETSISGGAISAHDSASIANLFAKEKDQLTQTVAIKNDQIDELKLKVYRLENEISALKIENKSSAAKRRTSRCSQNEEIVPSSQDQQLSLIDTVYKKRDSTVNSVTSDQKKKTVKKKKGSNANKRSSVTTNGLKSSSVSSVVTNGSVVQPVSKCANCSSLEELSVKFPKIKLKTFLNCRQKFDEADLNKDGTVDSEELATILESAGLYFTQSQIHDILTKVDADDDIALDFTEVLQVVSTLEENPNRRADLPKSLKDNQSKVCSVM